MPYSHNVRLVGYHDLQDRPGFKLAMQEVDDRWYLYLGHLWHSGWTILDVTDPSAPQMVRWIDGPPNTWTLQIQLADGKMIAGLERIPPGWGGDPNGPSGEEGFVIWDVAADPTQPRPLGEWKGGGTHRNYYDGGRYVHASAELPGFAGQHYVAVDIEDPQHPVSVGKWWWPGQNQAAGEEFSAADAKKSKIFLHGGAYVEENLAYCPWSGSGVVILDVADVAAPKLVGHLAVDPPFSNMIPLHTVVPLLDRGIAIINGEAIKERCDEPLVFAGVIDIASAAAPRLMSILPTPQPPEGYPVPDFSMRGGRFGPHNQHQPQHQSCLRPSDQYVFMTYFNAGLQIFDISNPRLPTIAGCYLPDDPQKRVGPLPTELVMQAEDVLVDRRGYIYMTEKNSGLYVMEFLG